MSKNNDGVSGSRVALVTCAELPMGDADDAELIRALQARGIAAQWEIWDDRSVLWQRYNAVVIRSTWDYSARRDEFLRWAAGVAARGPMVQNPIDLLQWNSDKSYLQDLRDNGIPIVPTTWFSPGTECEWPDVEFVVKPSVGAGSMGAGRFDPSRPGAIDAARTHTQMLHAAGRTVLVQPYLTQVDLVGERALLYFNGRFSHAITKAALLAPAAAHPLRTGASSAGRAPLFMVESISSAIASDAELVVGAEVLSLVAQRHGEFPLYARVDVLPGDRGPVVIELELTEPSLFLTYDLDATATFADAISARIGRPAQPAGSTLIADAP